MKKIILFLFIFSFLAFDFVQTTDAHTLATDKTIGAIMHIDPNDDPLAQSPAYIFLSFKDTTGKFSPSACNCRIDILEEGKVIYSQPAFHGTSQDATVSYTFPQPDVYQIKIQGIPKMKNGFQPFVLTYTIRAEEPQPPRVHAFSNFANWIPFLSGGILLLVLLFGIQQYRHRKNMTAKNQSHKTPNTSTKNIQQF